jgi:hypothetical protein
MALNKGSQTTLDEWVETAAAAVRLGTELDVSSAYECTLYIKAALGDKTASTGQPEVIVQTTGEGSPAKEDWTNYFRGVGPVGTAVSADFGGAEAQGQTVLSITNPATQNVDNDGKFKFIKDSTVANCEVVFQTANSGDGGDTITILDGTAIAHDTDDCVMDLDDARNEVVAQWTLNINCLSLSRLRVIYNVDYDTDGPRVFTYCAYTLNTGV